MISKRIIPCLDIKDGKVVKGINFHQLRTVADPVEMARYYNESGADELVFYDISAATEQRVIFTDLLQQVAREVFIPLCVGGNIKTLDDIDRVLKSGADKVSINSGAIVHPEIIREGALRYGNQCIVGSVDVKRNNGRFEIFTAGGRKATGIDALEWVVQLEKLGAGELVINSIDTDGVRQGFDCELLNAVCARVNIPVIASGGAGKVADFVELFQNTDVDAGLAASIFHSKEVAIDFLKQSLRQEHIEMRTQGYGKIQ